MASSSGTKGLLHLAASWLAMVAVTAATILYFDDIRTLLGLKLEPGDLGIVAEAASDPGKGDEVRGRSAGPAEGVVVIRAGRNGHFETRAYVNGRAVDVLVDTGATTVALTYEDARAAGIFPSEADFRHRVSTANGTARVALVTLDRVSIDGITVRDVRAVVAEPGRLETTLLGMSFLGQLRRAEMSRGVLTLEQ